MPPRSRDTSETYDSDAQSDLFFDGPEGRRTRSEDRAARAAAGGRRRRGPVLWIMAIVLVAVLAAATWIVIIPAYRYFSPSDYDGSGSGTVVVEVQPNDDATAIGETLHAKGVVASVRAFTQAADDNADSQSIQPGSYRLHSHMSASSALALLLNSDSRVDADAIVTEGSTMLDVQRRLTARPCGSAATAVCGPGLSRTDVARALRNVAALGLPTDYTVSGRAPSSVEGFLFPATYYFPAKTSATEALQQMITRFTDQARSTNFTARARALGLTPYQELIVASIAQAEAKFPEDYAKVARVILNRLHADTPLQVDATSVYGAKLKGLDPAKVINSELDSPYNTYRNDGLPPTPISNPGADAMDGAAHPATGNWTYYVNGDAQGHLFFTNSYAQFRQAAERCRANNWGCG